MCNQLDEYSDSSDSDEGLCPGCKKKLGGDYNWQKFCDGCDQHFCIDCIAFTACQTTFGKCRNCFDYKCRHCLGDLERPYQQLYLDDEKPTPVCTKCIAIYYSNKSNDQE